MGKPKNRLSYFLKHIDFGKFLIVFTCSMFAQEFYAVLFVTIMQYKNTEALQTFIRYSSAIFSLVYSLTIWKERFTFTQKMLLKFDKSKIKTTVVNAFKKIIPKYEVPSENSFMSMEDSYSTEDINLEDMNVGGEEQ